MAGGSYDVVSVQGIRKEDLPALLSLQGLVNRSAPRVYFLSRPEGSEKHWIDWYKDYGLKAENLSIDEFLVKYAREAKGYIVYDPRLPDTVNVALSLAGVRDCVVCSPSWEKKFIMLGLKCYQNLVGKWSSYMDAYNWAIGNAMSDCNCSLLANYDHGNGFNAEPTFDFLVARKGFCMGLSINEADFPQEAALWDKVQIAAPEAAFMIGWHTTRDSEATHVYFASCHDITVYCGGAWNMSFHQHVQRQNDFSQDHCEEASCDADAKYATIVLSDGDSWHSMADVQKKFWLHPRRGEVALGWEVAPVFAKVAPGLLEYYYESRTENDYLICGPSGIGYNYLSGFGDWEGFLSRSQDILNETALKIVWVINRVVRHLPGGSIEHKLKDRVINYTRTQMEEFNGVKDQNGADWVDPEMVERYVSAMPDAMGFFQGWERIPDEIPRWVESKPWCPTSALVRRDVEATLKEFEEAAETQSTPAFVAGHVNCYDADMDSVIEVGRRLTEKGFTVVRPDVFLQLAADAFKKGLRK